MKNLLIKWVIFLLSLIVSFNLPVHAQIKIDAGTAVKAGAAAVEIWTNGKKKPNPFNHKSQSKDTAAVLNFNSKNASEFAAFDIRDLSGVWEGEESNEGLIMYYSISLTKLGSNSYSGFDYCIWEKNIDRKPVTANGGNVPKAKKSFIGNFEKGELSFTEIQELENSKWGLTNEKLKVVDDNGTPAIINDNNQPARKFYLKRTSQTFPSDYLKYVINDSTLQIINCGYRNSNNHEILKYADHGLLSVSIKNNSDIDLANLKGQFTTSEQQNGILNYDKLYGTFTIPKKGQSELPLNLNTDFSVPSGRVHFNIMFYYYGISIAQKTIEVPTESFYKLSNVTVAQSSSPRMKAVSGYYGFSNASFSDVSKQIESLVAGGDKMASMWKAAFLSMGYGEYKINEDEGYAIAKTAFASVENKARNGDAEALYLLFYACQMGLEGGAGKVFANDFLKKSASAGFLPARYDYALRSAEDKDYTNALNELQDVYNLGLKISANKIGLMYEKGWGANKDVNMAMEWYKKGMAFGDPEAVLSIANLYAAGLENTPPDPAKAMSLAAQAAAKNCTKAMVFLGEKYADGKQGIGRNISLAIKWLKEASDNGDRQAMLALGEIYLGDLPGLVKDEHTGLFWIKKAAEAGSPKAMLILAKYYNEGTLVEKDIIAARYWYNQAVLKGKAQQDNTGLLAASQSFMDFWKYADFSPSYVYVDEGGNYLRDGDDGLFNGLFSGLMGSMGSYYGNQQQLIDGLEYVCKKDGCKIYGGTVSSNFFSNLYLKRGQTVDIKVYGIVSTGMMSGPATADGLGNNWQEYAIIKGIPCSSVIATVKGSNDWKFIGQSSTYTAANEGQLALALNAIDYRNYKGYFDVVVQVQE
jgi:TPR repeat protein